MQKLFAVIAMVLFCAGFVFAQSTNTATIDQYGHNFAKVTQTGNYNNADVDMGTSSDPVTNNYQPHYSGDWIEGVYIDQVGDNNVASTNIHATSSYATGNHNGTSIYQYGNLNEAYQDVATYYSRTTNWSRMGLDIDQIGDNNYANQKTLPSFGTYGVQGMIIVQDGDDNYANQLSIGGMQNITEITQVGNYNNNPTVSGNPFDLTPVTDQGWSNPLLLPWAHKPAGDYTQYTNQNSGVTHMYVAGDGNNTAQYQEYSVWATSGHNEAYIDITGNFNNAAQGQLGESNSSDIDIWGDNNVATTTQWGDYNEGSIYMTGDNNVGAIDQIGDNNIGSINQVGDNNTGLILQH